MNAVGKVGVGDVICTRTSNSVAAFFIRLGAALLDKPNGVNHVVIVHHFRDGNWWGIEGRPGGVGWTNINSALDAPFTVTNAEQPKTDVQRAAIATAAEGLLGTPYDWEGIAEDGMKAIRAKGLYKSKEWGDKTPDHVVCSSLADWVYDHVGLASPGKKFDRTVTPGDWAEFIIKKGWSSP